MYKFSNSTMTICEANKSYYGMRQDNVITTEGTSYCFICKRILRIHGKLLDSNSCRLAHVY